MISKSLLGIHFFDEIFGGIYKGRAVLISGRQGIGKSIAGLNFLSQGLQLDERCMLLGTMSCSDFSIYSGALGFDLMPEINSGRLVLLEYSNFVPEHGFSEGSMLPPDGFDHLRSIIESNLIQRVVLDTVLPWVALRTPDRLSEHVFSFVRFLDRLGVTTVMTIPKPVSAMAFRLKNALENTVPISCVLSPTAENGVCLWQTAKYFGERKMAAPVKYVIQPGAGIVRAGAAQAPVSGDPLRAPPRAAMNAGDVNGDQSELRRAYNNAGWVSNPPAVSPSPAASNSAAPAAGIPSAAPRAPAVPGPDQPRLPFSAVWSPKTVASPKRGLAPSQG